MALPFDLRAYAAAAGSSDDEGSRASGPMFGTPGRPSRAIVISADIVAGVRAQDAEAFRELVRLTYIPLVRFARTVLGARDEAEDVVQDVFTMIWDRASQWQPSTDPSAYLFRSVRNHALNEIRRQSRATLRAEQVEGSGEWRSDSSDTPSSSLDALIEDEAQATQRQLMESVLASCTEHQRTVYDLRYSRGLSAAAIAEVLGITERSAAKLIVRVTHLVLDRLRERVHGLK